MLKKIILQRWYCEVLRAVSTLLSAIPWPPHVHTLQLRIWSWMEKRSQHLFKCREHDRRVYMAYLKYYSQPKKTMFRRRKKYSHITGKLFSSTYHNNALINSVHSGTHMIWCICSASRRHTFHYKVVVTRDGILAYEDEGSPKLDQMIIRRYPKAIDNGWDFWMLGRLKILKMLMSIKHTYAALFDQVDRCICRVPRFSKNCSHASHVAEI